TEPKAPGLFSKAEAGSRQIVLQIGLGFTAFIIGSIFSAGAATRILDRIGLLDSEALEWFLRTVLERTWLFVFVPAIGFGIGRFTEIKASRFAMIAGFSGEIVSLLLVTGMNGLDYVTQDARGVIARLLGLFVGMALTVVAVNAGRRSAAVAQARGLAEAAKRKDEYAAFLAAAEEPKPGDDAASKK
ncbi:MAG: hypothetical protein JNM17_34040, partial [Archangium sp.]|nr:hypothetical protein [Archangium sp.]